MQTAYTTYYQAYRTYTAHAEDLWKYCNDEEFVAATVAAEKAFNEIVLPAGVDHDLACDYGVYALAYEELESFAQDLYYNFDNRVFMTHLHHAEAHVRNTRIEDHNAALCYTGIDKEFLDFQAGRRNYITGLTHEQATLLTTVERRDFAFVLINQDYESDETSDLFKAVSLFYSLRDAQGSDDYAALAAATSEYHLLLNLYRDDNVRALVSACDLDTLNTRITNLVAKIGG